MAERRTTARRLAAGCAAGIAIASAGTWLRFSMERTARIDTHTWAFMVASAVSGVGLVTTGVCALRLGPRATRLSWRALWAWTAVVHAVAASALALTSSDVFANLAFGALLRAGLSPYVHAPAELVGSPWPALVASRWSNDPSPYGPLFHPVAATAAWIGERLASPLWGSFYAYKILLVAAVLAALALAARHLRATEREDARETWVVLALGPLVAWEVSAQGHNEGLLLLALVAFIAAAAARREVLAVVALAAGVAIKYALAPLLALYVLLAARRSIARAAGLALLAAAIVGAAFAPEWRTVTLRSVTPMVGGEAARHAHSVTDLVCLLLDALRLPRASAAAYRALSAGSAVLCGAWLVRIAWTARTFAALAHGYLGFLFALYLTTPWFQPWYVCWALPFLLVEPDPAWRRFVALFAVVTVAQWAVPLDPVTTVLADAWAATRLWKMRRCYPARLAEPTP